MNNNYLRGIYLRLAGVVTLVVMLGLGFNAYLSHRTFEKALAPQMAKKVVTIGAGIRALVVRAVDSGVDFRQLYGVTERFKEVRAESPEISYIAVTDEHGQVQHESAVSAPELKRHFSSAGVLALLQTPEAVAPIKRIGEQYLVSMPILSGSQALGVLHIGVNVGFVDDMVLDMLYDVLVVLVVSLFVTVELLHFIAGAKLEASLRELGATFDRGASGNFATRGSGNGGGADLAFASLMKVMKGTLERINLSYGALAREVDLSRSVPAHERQPGLAAAQSGLQSLASRFRFGTDTAPRDHSDSDLAKVRAPLFMFILAEELTRSFLPGYVSSLLVPIPGLSPQIVIGLPIVLFMLIVAIGQPFLGVYCERVGHRRTMLTGATVAAAGFAATALASTVLDLLLWRSFCAIGYAMVFVAGQAYVLDHATPANRARSFAVFIGAIMAATVCGPSIGGILADNIGVRETFGIAACLAAASVLVIRGLPNFDPLGRNRPPARLPSWREFGNLLANARFMTVTGLAAIPAKVLLTGVCFYLIPMYVLSLGSTQAMAGRILMTYAVVMVVLGPIMAGLASGSERMQWLVGGGLMVSGLGGVAMLAGGGVEWVFLGVVLIGVGQSMSMAAQSALLSEHCAAEVSRLGEGVVYGVYRLLERMGNALGPLLAAVLVLHFDYRTAFVLIGAAVLLCGAAFILATRHSRQANTPLNNSPLTIQTGEPL